MLNVLVIGAGTMGSTHGDALSKMENVSLVGIVDKNLEKAKELGRKLGAEAFGTYEEAIESKPIDVVSICLPTPIHKPYVEKVADQGFHIICEKPLARNLKDAREMIDYCKAKKVKLFVGHVVRFFPEYVQAKEVIEQGSIGNVAVARTYRGGAFPYGSNDWYADYESSGGLVLDMIIHDFDFLRWCFGEVERVYAKSVEKGNERRIDYSLVTLRFKSGVIAHVEGSWAHQTFTTNFEFAGETGIVEHDSSKSVPVRFAGRNQSQSGGGVAVPESPLKKNPYYLELEHFLSCVESDREPIVTAEDAYKAMEIALAALQSIETKKEVELDAFARIGGVK
ncbi:Gfo/Idh/MocA family protein [Fictibacillus phosphorivorans]|uniref:Gfo/Idh/MocA family protein n=1 Tax=Fictibacillus phosphorivorans TaxID=1221500 RepID=UPI00204186DA|nr:Gfo/Idh/MocA family oxidoreductase [Fictibacillus phosphorivorans]MCM3775621.1 Gfo/Idh/MocA family oxidoreductase [Fictibacillus phosphorivorans]